MNRSDHWQNLAGSAFQEAPEALWASYCTRPVRL